MRAKRTEKSVQRGAWGIALALCAWGGLAVLDATAQPTSAQEEPRAEDDGAPRFAGDALGLGEIERALREGEPLRFRPIGTSSRSFQVDLAGPIDAAFRPESRAHPRGWLAEVAAYRIGRALGLDDVPPALLRGVERGVLRREIEGDFDAIEGDLAWSGNVLRGAFVYWVPNMVRTAELDTPAGIRRWSAWLAQDGVVPEGERALARDLSNVLVFDFVIGNRDRWSGGNAQPTPEGRLVIRDHNLAFPSQLDVEGYARMNASLRRTTRFSRSAIERLIALDADALREVTADEQPASVLDERQMRAVLERRETVLTYVGALIEAHGADAVLYFE